MYHNPPTVHRVIHASAFFRQWSYLWHNANANSSFMDHHTPHLPLQAYIMKWLLTETGSKCSLFSCTYIHTAHTAENMHLIKQLSLNLLCFWYLGWKKRGDAGSCSLSEWSVFLCFHLEMWKLLHRGIIVSEEKTPLGWFKGRSNEISYVLYQVYVSIWTIVWFVMWHHGSLFFVWHLYMGKIQSAKQGNLLFNFCFIRSRWLLFQPSVQNI